jgi:hypothetical protein
MNFFKNGINLKNEETKERIRKKKKNKRRWEKKSGYLE